MYGNLIKPDFSIESELIQSGKIIAGLDEAGRGPLMGPVVAAAVVFTQEPDLPKLNDSKKLSEKNREELYTLINEQAHAVGVGIVDNYEIDQTNILRATMKAMHLAADMISDKFNYLVIDGNYFKSDTYSDYLTIVKGDSKSISIAAASVIAKVTRDRWVYNQAQPKYPNYGFASHKGYATAKHIDALKEYGPCEFHRLTFLSRIINTSELINRNNCLCYDGKFL